jgi:hypothetical protein
VFVALGGTSVAAVTLGKNGVHSHRSARAAGHPGPGRPVRRAGGRGKKVIGGGAETDHIGAVAYRSRPVPGTIDGDQRWADWMTPSTFNYNQTGASFTAYAVRADAG